MSKRNSREAKARRRAEREARANHAHVRDDEDLSLCRWPGCAARWVLDIERTDGMAAFLCEAHGLPMIDELAGQGLLQSISSSDIDLAGPAASASYPQWERGQA